MPDDANPRDGLSPQQCQPTNLDLNLREEILAITWADGVTSRYPTTFLRSKCPCAACRTQREQQSKTLLPILSSTQTARSTVVGGELVGHYALQLVWSDGHNTGIFDFRLLRALAAELPTAPTD